MNNKHRAFMQNFVIWNFITSFFLFPIGMGFSVAYIIIFSAFNLIFGETISVGFVLIPISMLVFFVVFRIFLYSNKLYKKKFTKYLIKLYLVTDVLFSLIVFFVHSYRDYSENFSNSRLDTVNYIKLILYVFSVIMLSVLSVLVFKFYRIYQDDKRSSLIKKLYITYFLLIPLFVVTVFTSTMNFSFYAIHGILENIIWGFAMFMCNKAENENSNQGTSLDKKGE